MERAIALAWKTVTDMVDSFFSNLPNLVIGFAIFFLFISVAKFAKKAVFGVTSRARIDQTLGLALASLAQFGVTFLGLLIAAVIVIPNFSPASLIAGLGITSVAIGFAFQDILRNFFAGLLLLWQKPFGVGDEIKTGDYIGIVQEIDIRATQLMMASGEVVIVPNGDVYTKPIVVYTASGKRRAILKVKLEKSDDLNASRKEILDVLRSTEKVANDPPPAVMVGDIEPGSVVLDVYFWTEPHQTSLIAVTDVVSMTIRERLKNIGKQADVIEKTPAPGAENGDHNKSTYADTNSRLR